MKKLSLFLALLLMLSSFGAVLAEEAEAPAGGPPGQAAMTEEEAAAAAEQEALLKQDCEFSLIEADGEQPRLTYIEGVTTILKVDGYYFKDLNKNGELDVYEDWRQETDARVADLISQMTVEEEVGLLFCVNTQLADAADTDAYDEALRASPSRSPTRSTTCRPWPRRSVWACRWCSPRTASTTPGAATSTSPTRRSALPTIPNWPLNWPRTTRRR